MIEIEIERQDGKISGCRVKGHNGEYGADIVCAGVSSIVQTALLGIGKHLHREVSYRVASGDFFLKLKEAPDDFTEAVLETMRLGLEEIQKIEPDAVKIAYRER